VHHQCAPTQYPVQELREQISEMSANQGGGNIKIY
jgi:hypothetical protein